MRVFSTRLATVGLLATSLTAGAAAQSVPVDDSPRAAPLAAPKPQPPFPRVVPPRKRVSPGDRSRLTRPQGVARGNSAASVAAKLGDSGAPRGLSPGVLDFGNGLTSYLSYTSQSAANPIGGIRQGTAYAGQIFFGLDADLNRLGGLEGASLHTIVTQRHGRSLSYDLIGNDTAVQEIWGGGQTARLTRLSYQQKLFDNRLDFEVGRLNALLAFSLSPIQCNFQSIGVCGLPIYIIKNTNYTYFPLSTWGGQATFWLDSDKKYFFHIGAFEVNPSFELPTDNGIDFSVDKATGAVVPLEIGYSTTFANDSLPRNYVVGAVIDRSRYNDPVLDVAGGARLFSGLAPMSQFGRSLVYARFDQMIWRPDPTEPRGLTIFGSFLKPMGGRQIQDYTIQLGLVQVGTFADRPYDTVGFVVSNQKYSSLGFADIRAARAFLGLDPRDVATNQITMELNYGIQLGPSARLIPNLQYIVNPDQTRFPFRPRPIPDTFVLGARFSCDLYPLFDFAKGRDGL